MKTKKQKIKNKAIMWALVTSVSLIALMLVIVWITKQSLSQMGISGIVNWTTMSVNAGGLTFICYYDNEIGKL